jgi:DnaJ-class molecular chaperone
MSLPCSSDVSGLQEQPRQQRGNSAATGEGQPPAPQPCRDCHGSGLIAVFRNHKGEVDFLDGIPTGERMTCALCNGEGYEE